MKAASNNASEIFRLTFKRVRRELSKASGFGFSFAAQAKDMEISFRKAMIDAGVPATPARLQMINSWIMRASKLGGAV